MDLWGDSSIHDLSERPAQSRGPMQKKSMRLSDGKNQDGKAAHKSIRMPDRRAEDTESAFSDGTMLFHRQARNAQCLDSHSKSGDRFTVTTSRTQSRTMRCSSSGNFQIALGTHKVVKFGSFADTKH